MKDVKAVLVANLNTKIAAIEAEKIAAGFPNTGLLPVDTTAGYFEQTLHIHNLDIDPALFYGIEEITTTGQSLGPATQSHYKIWCDIIVIDGGSDTLIINRLHRYSRALREVFEENWDTALSNASKIKIETPAPISFKLNNNSSEWNHVGGVLITTALG